MEILFFIKQDKNLDVYLATLDTTKNKFNKYLLDEKTKQWNFIDKDEPTIYLKPVINKTQVYNSKNEIMAKPLKPELISDNVKSKADSVKRKYKIVTKIDEELVGNSKKKTIVKSLKQRQFTVDAEGRPDLEIYNGVTFEVTEDCKTFDPAEAKTEWYLVEFEKIEKTDKYKVTFSFPSTGPMRKYEVIARPLKDKNRDAALKKYDAAYSSYKQQLSAKDKLCTDSLKNEERKYEDVFQKYLDLQKRNAELYSKQRAQTAETEQVVYRTFQIKQFGIWNSDCPQSMPQGMEVFAKFETTQGENVSIAAVYLVEKGKNALYNLYIPKKISFNPDAENILLIVTNKGKLGWIKNNVFQTIGKATKNFTFKVNMLDKQTYTETDINSFLI